MTAPDRNSLMHEFTTDDAKMRHAMYIIRGAMIKPDHVIVHAWAITALATTLGCDARRCAQVPRKLVDRGWLRRAGAITKSTSSHHYALTADGWIAIRQHILEALAPATPPAPPVAQEVRVQQVFTAVTDTPVTGTPVAVSALPCAPVTESDTLALRARIDSMTRSERVRWWDETRSQIYELYHLEVTLFELESARRAAAITLDAALTKVAKTREALAQIATDIQNKSLLRRIDVGDLDIRLQLLSEALQGEFAVSQ